MVLELILFGLLLLNVNGSPIDEDKLFLQNVLFTIPKERKLILKINMSLIFEYVGAFLVFKNQKCLGLITLVI